VEGAVLSTTRGKGAVLPTTRGLHSCSR
jgi:hypothetical protein